MGKESPAAFHRPSPWGPIDRVELRNRVVSELSRHGWVRVDELAVMVDVDLRSLVRGLKVIQVQEHIEADGDGRVRRAPVVEEARALETTRGVPGQRAISRK